MFKCRSWLFEDDGTKLLPATISRVFSHQRQVFEQDHGPQTARCKTCNQFGLVWPAEAIANQPPDKHASRGHREGGKPNCYRDDDDVDLQKRERDIHRHGVDAGSDRRLRQGGKRSSLGWVTR